MSKKIKITALVGIPGSGKSTWRKNHIENSKDGTVVSVCRDDLRIELYGDDYKFSKEKERHVSIKKMMRCHGYVDDSSVKEIIIDETHCSDRGRRSTLELVKAVEDNGTEVDFEWKVMEWSYDVDRCHKNNTNRTTPVPYTVIESMFVNFIQFISASESIRPAWVPSKGLLEQIHNPNTRDGRRKEDFFIVDIDGTIADHTGIRSPFDWDAVSLDVPRKQVIKVINSVSSIGRIQFFSGRDGVCRADTSRWIKSNVPLFDMHHPFDIPLYMREEGSMEKDYIVKMKMLSIFNANKLPHIIGVFDDRQQVCRYWRAFGFTTFQVDAGLF